MSILKKVSDVLPSGVRDQLFVSTWSFFNVPLLFWIRPKIIELNSKRTEIKIPLNRRTKNHLNSLYFGVLAAGADCAGGILAMKLAKESGANISLAFKDFNAKFLKRAEGDTHFICDQGKEISEFVDQVRKSDSRLSKTVQVYAICPDVTGDEPVATFDLTLSLKNKTK